MSRSERKKPKKKRKTGGHSERRRKRKRDDDSKRSRRDSSHDDSSSEEHDHQRSDSRKNLKDKVGRSANKKARGSSEARREISPPHRKGTGSPSRELVRNVPDSRFRSRSRSRSRPRSSPYSRGRHRSRSEHKFAARRRSRSSSARRSQSPPPKAIKAGRPRSGEGESNARPLRRDKSEKSSRESRRRSHYRTSQSPSPSAARLSERGDRASPSNGSTPHEEDTTSPGPRNGRATNLDSAAVDQSRLGCDTKGLRAARERSRSPVPKRWSPSASPARRDSHVRRAKAANDIDTQARLGSGTGSEDDFGRGRRRSLLRSRSPPRASASGHQPRSFRSEAREGQDRDRGEPDRRRRGVLSDNGGPSHLEHSQGARHGGWKKQSRSPARKRWSPSPSPTAPRGSERTRSRSSQGRTRALHERRHSWRQSLSRSNDRSHRNSRRSRPGSPTVSLSASPDRRPLPVRGPLEDGSPSKQKGAPRANGEATNGKEERSPAKDAARRGSAAPSPHASRQEGKTTQKTSPRPRQQSKSSSKKRKGGKQALLSFGDDMSENDRPSGFQGLGAATINEFKRNKVAQPPRTLTPIADDNPQPIPTAIARLGSLTESKTDVVLRPPKISTAECRGQREYQEDRHVVISCLHSPEDAHTKFEANPPCFFAVYDGHNGDLASEIAKSKLHTYVAKAAPTTGLLGQPPELLEGLLRAAFASTEAEILDRAQADGGRQDGTTVTACLLVGDVLVTANVGDSRAVLGSSGRGGNLRSTDLSSDHKPEAEAEKSRIESAGGEVVFNGCYRIQHKDVACRLAVSRSLGDQQFKGTRAKSEASGEDSTTQWLVSPEPSVKSVRLSSRDRLVIVASDGLWDVITSREAVEIAHAAYERAPSSARRAPSWADALTSGVGGDGVDTDPASALVKEAMKRETADNVTVVVATLPWD